jgi:hypothetical protein
MPTPGEKSATAEGARPARKRALRPWLRALHRDAGYFVVGFTIIYAVSGLAVNHIGQWDPNFRQVHRTHQVALPKGADDAALTAAVLSALGITDRPDESFRESEHALAIQLKDRTLHVDTQSGAVDEEGQSPRFFLRVANYLHLNRGKAAWRYIADLYAVLLLVLAVSGLFMIPGRKGLVGRGALIAGLGAAIPVVYVILSGTP